MSGDGKVVRNLIAENYSNVTMSRVCIHCQGRGFVQDRSVARPAVTFNGPITSDAMPPTVKCIECVSGWQFKELNVGDFLDWLVEELKRHVENNPRAFLNAVVEATENVMTEQSGGPR
jgi:hypothetical protein